MTITELLTEWAQLEPERVTITFSSLRAKGIPPLLSAQIKTGTNTTTLRFKELEKGDLLMFLEYRVRDAIEAKPGIVWRVGATVIERNHYAAIEVSGSQHAARMYFNTSPAHALLEAYIGYLETQS